MIWNVIEEKNPLKQGLKQKLDVMIVFSEKIEEKNPLKQGLKPEMANTATAKI